MGQPELSQLGRHVAELQDRAVSSARGVASGEDASRDGVRDGVPPQLDLVAGRARLLSVDVGDVAARSRSVRRVPRLFALAAVLAAILGVVLGARGLRRPDPLRFALGDEANTAGTVGAWIASPAAAPREVRFSDGSALTLAPGGRARVTALEADGAEVAIEQGELEVSVVHREHTRWSVRGGPYVVHVTGTRFRVRWDPSSERFDVALREGSIVVSGPVVGDGRAVRAGEQLTITKRTLEVSTIDGPVGALDSSGSPVGVPSDSLGNPVGAPQTPPGEVAEVPSAVGSASAHDPPAKPDAEPGRGSPNPSDHGDRGSAGAHRDHDKGAAAAPPPADDPEGWRALGRAARYKDALAAAERDGFDNVCATASAGDLRALGDVARLGGRAARASQVYTAIRARFPGTPDASMAAFILGRMAQDQGHDDAGAARWFATYLREAPGGDLAQDALGRLVGAADRLGDPSGAERAAERYLAAYPNGPHAGFARQVLARRATP
jgi:hypothetical protein